MKLEGVVGACELPDIFHLLSSTARRGVLVVSKGNTRRKVYFGPEGITLFFDSQRAGGLLGQILLGRGVIREHVLDAALQRQSATGRPLGEILCTMGAARPEQVEEALAYQLREELFYILTWDSAHFEFHEGAEHPADAGRNYPRTPSFNTDAILMEAARRADEWKRIRQLITSEHAVPLRLSTDLPLTGELAASEVASAVLKLADGTASIQQMVETLRRSEFDVYESVWALLHAGAVKLADASELANLAAAALELGDTQRACTLLTNAAACCGDHLELRYDIGTMFLMAGDEEHARHHLDIVLARLVDEKLATQIDEMLGRIRDEFPEVPYSYERRLKLLDPERDFQDALPLALHLVELYRRRGDVDRAKNMLRHLNEFVVTETADLLRLAQLLESHGSPIRAARRYTLAANQLRYLGHNHEAVRIYRRALGLDDRLTAARQELNYLLTAPRRRLARLALWSCLALTILAALGGIVFQFHREHLAYQALIRADASVAQLLLKGEFGRAVEGYAAVAADYPYTTISPEARERIVAIEQRRRVREEARIEAEHRLLESAQAAERGLDLPGAIASYRELAGVARTEALALRASEHVRRLEAETDEYNALVVQAREHEAARRYPTALQSYLAARTRSPRLFEHDRIGLPVLVESQPSGAEVVRAGTRLGTTPLLLHRQAGDAGDMLLRLAGFCDTPFVLPREESAPALTVELVPTRDPLWTFRGTGVIDHVPRVVGPVVYLNSRQGRLYAVSLHTGRKLWERELSGPSGGCVSPPLVMDDRLVVAAMDGSLSAFSRDAGTPLWRRAGHGLLAGPPSALPSEKLVAVFYPDAAAEYVDPARGTMVRQATLPRAIVGSMLVVDDVLLYGTDDHALQAVDLKGGRAIWKWRPGRPVTHPLTCGEGVLFVPLQDMGLAAVRLGTGEPLWRFEGAGGPVTACTTDGRKVFVSSGKGPLVALDAVDGRVLWRAPLDGPLTVPAAADGRQVVVATADGTLEVFRPSDGTVLWKFHLGAAPAAGPVIGADRILVTMTDGTMQAFPR